MSRFSCPRCATLLDDTRSDGQRLYRCHTCAGHAINLSQLRTRLPEGAFRGMWQAARAAEAIGPGCPVCSRAMRVITAGRAAVEVDVCVGCQMLWLDAGEQEKLGVAPTPQQQQTPQQREAHLAASVLLAEAKVASDAERYRMEKTTRRRAWWISELFDALLWWSI